MRGKRKTAMIRRTLTRAFRLFRGDRGSRFALAETISRQLVPAHFFGEDSKTWNLIAKGALPFEPHERGRLARRWDRLWVLHQYASTLSEVEGDYVEFGVFQGDSARVLLASNPRPRYWGFDSFEGLSRPTPSVDGNYWRAGDLSSSYSAVVSQLSEWGDRVRLIRGWIPDVFQSADVPSLVRVAHIDVDLYEPTAASIEFAAGRLAAGGVIICDDYGFATCPGATRAIDEFVASHEGWKLVHLPSGQGILSRRL